MKKLLIYSMIITILGLISCTKSPSVNEEIIDIALNFEIQLHLDLSNVLSSEHQSVMDRVIEVIQDRLNNAGIMKFSVQPYRSDQILIQLPDNIDIDGVRSIIGRTGLLEFKLVATFEDQNLVINQMDAWLSDNHELFPFLAMRFYIEYLDNDLEWHEGLFKYLIGSGRNPMSVHNDYTRIIHQLINDFEFKAAVRPGFQFLLGSLNHHNETPIYVVLERTELTGAYLSHVEARISDNDFGGARPEVSLTFNREGARIFERVTQSNIGRNLAIVLDDIVFIAPMIMDRIRGGEVLLTGNFTRQEVNEIVIVLKSGNLPVHVSIIDERYTSMGD